MWLDVDPAAGEPQEHLIRANPSGVEGRAVSLDQSVPSVANAVSREGYVHALSIPNTSQNKVTKSQDAVWLLPLARPMPSKESKDPARSAPASDIDQQKKFLSRTDTFYSHLCHVYSISSFLPTNNFIC